MASAGSSPRLVCQTPAVRLARVDVLPDSQVVVFARDDDYFFGVLHS